MENQIPPNHSQQDEVDLFDLIQALWSAKLLIFIVTLLVTCVAAAYAFLSTPVYQADVQALPPTANDLSSYNIGSQLTGAPISGITTGLVINGTTQVAVPNSIRELSPKEAYSTFLQHLASQTVRQQFFEQLYLPAHHAQQTSVSKERLWKQLNKDLKVITPQKPTDIEAKISIDGTNPKTLAEWANAYVAIAANAAKKELMADLAGEIHVRQKSITEQIAAVRKIALIVRQNRIQHLNDAIEVAESVGLLQNSAPVGPHVNPFLANQTYLLGAKALRAELNILSQRKSDDPYIPELPDLLKKQALLNSVDLNPDHLSVATIDRAATAPEEPIKPKKALTLILGVILGGILGVFIALVRRKLKKS
ncbi:LPS O-antigen chain length determinant protein WzzB [Paralcaligenes ginsengisoli]